MKELFNFLSTSKIIQVSIAATIFTFLTILALSFGASLYVQAKHGCFDKIVSNFIEEVEK